MTIVASANLVIAYKYNTEMLPEIQVWCKLMLFIMSFMLIHS